ncbi:MAG: hemolysin [Candidatus Vogelbacteria bacterium CG10_big_fil_rev_8_21_14_0_10_51_16]|uniref:Hemolysin n=1 Tax=Candidatus Vogelbacteria bacterium CG10_big_fil_rev_8_21_14_0_10_51_16 TaxID=1975045 RepID=A0A2H0RFG1_9BACT|nr:MAG: hemolysin [Candidatus Vogelbacteria bacterium CG10_big_fil_rev_8_21_14_0_10_51_16]
MDEKLEKIEKPESELVSALTHLVATGLSVAVLVALVVRAASVGTAWHVVSVSIFGASLILLYAASSSYHLVPARYERAKARLRRLDHSAVFLLIAGTYTPICLTVLRGGWGWSLFGVVWGLAFLAAGLQLSRLRHYGWLTPAIAVIMGWLALLAFQPIVVALSWSGFLVLLLGGLAYTVGVIFFVIEGRGLRLGIFRMHDLFHLFVMLGSTIHVALVWWYVL